MTSYLTLGLFKQPAKIHHYTSFLFSVLTTETTYKCEGGGGIICEKYRTLTICHSYMQITRTDMSTWKSLVPFLFCCCPICYKNQHLTNFRIILWIILQFSTSTLNIFKNRFNFSFLQG
jgi:hypothetical protein